MQQTLSSSAFHSHNFHSRQQSPKSWGDLAQGPIIQLMLKLFTRFLMPFTSLLAISYTFSCKNNYLNQNVSPDTLKIYLNVYGLPNKKIWMIFNGPKAFESLKKFSYHVITNEEFILGKCRRFSILKIHTTHSPSKAVILTFWRHRLSSELDKNYGNSPKRSALIDKIWHIIL